jgi:formyltetrahydrofolate deformylase
MIVSNHREIGQVVEPWDVPFHYIPVTSEARAEAESRQRQLVLRNADVIVLARYMQILSPAFVDEWPNRIINIHHSFLPAFAGASPYGQAFKHGVKLIGATAHYVTAELDAGPIIEQDVQRVDHRQTIDDLRRIGRQVERAVLARAVIWHVEDRILVHGNKTLVFA